jgi:hypothetical protein
LPLATAATLSSCADCSEPNALQSSSRYRIGWRQEPNYNHPIDAWTRNPELEAFIRNAIQEKGVRQVIADYRLECSPRPSAPACPDCFICSDKFQDNRLALPCVNYGTMSMHIELGPGSQVAAMTYWKTTRAAREN